MKTQTDRRERKTKTDDIFRWFVKALPSFLNTFSSFWVFCPKHTHRSSSRRQISTSCFFLFLLRCKTCEHSSVFGLRSNWIRFLYVSPSEPKDRRTVNCFCFLVPFFFTFLSSAIWQKLLDFFALFEGRNVT